MCFFSPDGDLEIQERRPRYHGEPRHKRLAFVKGRGSGRSDNDWDSRTNRSSNRSSHWSSVPERWQREHHSPPPRFSDPPRYNQHHPYGSTPFMGQQAPHGQHLGFGQQLPHGQIPMAGQHPPHGQHPGFNPHAHHGQPQMIGPQGPFAQPFHGQPPPGAAMMAHPNPIRPLPPNGFQQQLGGGRGHENDIIQVIEPGNQGHGHFRGRDQHHIEGGPRAHMPRNMGHNHGRGRSQHRDHRRRDESVYSFDDDDSFGSDQRLFRGSRSGWGSDSDDSFAGPLRSPRRRNSRPRW